MKEWYKEVYNIWVSKLENGEVPLAHCIAKEIGKTDLAIPLKALCKSGHLTKVGRGAYIPNHMTKEDRYDIERRDNSECPHCESKDTIKKGGAKGRRLCHACDYTFCTQGTHTTYTESYVLKLVKERLEDGCEYADISRRHGPMPATISRWVKVHEYRMSIG